jgi:hypothetical protein
VSFRSVAYEDVVTKKLEDPKTNKKFPRLEDLWRGFEWRLARDPGIGVPVPGSVPTLCVVKTRDSSVPGVPTVLVLYTFDTTVITVLDVLIR